MVGTGSEKDKKARMVLALDSDKLAWVAGALMGTIVRALNLFVVQADAFEIIFRVGLAFGVTYAATFLFVRIFLRVVLFELIAMKRQKREDLKAKRVAEAEAGRAAEAEAEEAPGEEQEET